MERQNGSQRRNGYARLGDAAQRPATPTPVRAYEQLYRHLRATQHTDDMLLIAAFVNMLLVLCVYMFVRHTGTEAALTAAFIASTLWFGISASALAIWRGAAIRKPDDALFGAALTFLAGADWDDTVLDAVARRAEISQSRAQTRNLVALLILPIVVSAFSTARGESLGAWAVAGLVILMLLVPLVQEVFTNGIDTLIRHAIVEHQVANRTTRTNSLLHTLLEPHTASVVQQEETRS